MKAEKCVSSNSNAPEAREKRMAQLFSKDSEQTAATDGGQSVDLPNSPKSWIKASEENRQMLLWCLSEIEQKELTSCPKIEAKTDGLSTISNYLSNEGDLNRTLVGGRWRCR